MFHIIPLVTSNPPVGTSSTHPSYRPSPDNPVGPDDPFGPCAEEVRYVLASVPEFLSRYLELVSDDDDDPGANQAFIELAEYVSELAKGIESVRPLLTRCLDAVEKVAESSEDAEELVGWSFLDYLSVEARRVVLPWLGPQTLLILESIEDPAAG
jgi:hypothetical protein